MAGSAGSSPESFMLFYGIRHALFQPFPGQVPPSVQAHKALFFLSLSKTDSEGRREIRQIKIIDASKHDTIDDGNQSFKGL